jgi:hypothetical protein
MGLEDEAQDSYSSSIFLRKNGHTQMVIEGAESVTAYEPATGEQLWSSGGLKVSHHAGRTISGPTCGGRYCYRLGIRLSESRLYCSSLL